MSWHPTKSRGNVITSYRSTMASKYTITGRSWIGLGIINESLITSLRFRVNGMEFYILPRGTFDDDFEDFNEVEVLNNATHSIVMRG